MSLPAREGQTTIEPGSFRDRDGQVFYGPDGSVLRGLSREGLRHFEALAKTTFFARSVEVGRLVATRLDPEIGAEMGGRWAAVLRHERIPFVSYPYEWCFGMLRDAALLQLELLEEALGEGLILQDATSYNVHFTGCRPRFIDIPSFRIHSPGDPWVGYGQFCQLFLYPLMLQAYKNVPFQPWLRGRLDGIPPAEMNAILSARDVLRSGVLLHVVLQSALQDRYADARRSVRRDLQDAGFGRELIQKNVRGLRKLTSRLHWRRSRSEWSEYRDTHSYTEADAGLKEAFVRGIVESREWPQVWDLGCNTGVYSLVAARHARLVLALDADHLAVERLYRRLRAEGPDNVLPLVVNVAEPSPGLGWGGEERQRLEARGKPDLVLCLALVHHVVLTAGVPMERFIGWLRTLGGELIIEFVTRDDAMVQRLLLNKIDNYGDYDVGPFESALGESFRIDRRERLGSGSRILYYAVPRG